MSSSLTLSFLHAERKSIIISLLIEKHLFLSILSRLSKLSGNAKKKGCIVPIDAQKLLKKVSAPCLVQKDFKVIVTGFIKF